MAANPDGTNGGTPAQQVFGPQAGVYAESSVHIRDDSLDAVQRLAAQVLGCRWAADLGTGAGFTAFAMSEVARQVVATDITAPMLRETRRIGGERRLANVGVVQSAAESLPFADASLDLITSRVAAHHFRDFEAALDGAHRALATGGSLIIADSVSPEDDGISEWMNDIELRRDFSHVKNRNVPEITGMLEDRGMPVVGSENSRIYLRFNEWAARTRVTPEETARLRHDFLGAPPEVQSAFQVEQLEDGDIQFSWPCWIFRAEKG